MAKKMGFLKDTWSVFKNLSKLFQNYLRDMDVSKFVSCRKFAENCPE